VLTLGIPDRGLLCKDILHNICQILCKIKIICHWRSEFVNCGCVIGEDSNIDPDSVDILRSAIAIIVNYL